MSDPDSSGIRLKRLAQPQPGWQDFVGDGMGYYDAEEAWESFGGLSLQEAYDLSAKTPECFMDEFRAMGPKAFEYYFPVIDRILREMIATSDGEWEDSITVWAFGQIIATQLEAPYKQRTQECVAEMGDLASFVLEHAERHTRDKEDLQKVREHWGQVLAAATRKGKEYE